MSGSLDLAGILLGPISLGKDILLTEIGVVIETDFGVKAEV